MRFLQLKNMKSGVSTVSWYLVVFSADQRLLEESTSPICKNFAINNCQTGNFGALVQVFLTRAAELKASAQCEKYVYISVSCNLYLFLSSVKCYCLWLQCYTSIQSEDLSLFAAMSSHGRLTMPCSSFATCACTLWRICPRKLSCSSLRLFHHKRLVSLVTDSLLSLMLGHVKFKATRVSG